ncbi:Coiled-coil domain-containing protein 30 [Acipenser ruthenus]|uniref:Coiled-coil domain-containing protein 30 n=1 Tax=Acipenser ruthenus TaxID=7906 RepID=A0A444V4T2_ACIRT|nr:Coiled-coil domain-containing protein 30 [Acipenser ruthenus]
MTYCNPLPPAVAAPKPSVLEQGELDDILQRLREDGQEPGATADERLRHLWRLYLRSEGSLRALTQDLEEVRSQQVAEMKEVFCITPLWLAQPSLELNQGVWNPAKLKPSQVWNPAELKPSQVWNPAELEPSQQVWNPAELKPSQVENYVDHIRNLSEEREALTAEYERENEQLRGELQQLRLEQDHLLLELRGGDKTMNKVRNTEQSLLLELRAGAKTMNETHDAELSSERRRRECAERDLDEASRRLSMAHEEIRRLTDEVDIARKASSDLLELQRVKEHNVRLDKEILSLRSRVRSLDSERKTLLQTQLKSSRDREAVLEGCLTEEKEWRKQLEADLSAAQSALKKSKEELQRCRAEMQSLRASVEESSALNASLTQGREEKTLLERKVCELELSAKRLEGDVEQHRAACSQAKEELRKCREREAELRGELHRAEGEHSTLRGEVLESRAQGAYPQQRLSESVQERLGLELQSHRLRQGTGREASPEQPQHRPSHRVTGEGVNQLVSLKVEMGRLQSTLEEERLLASQHQLALQAQIGEGHGRAKSQESLLQQMGEECRQLKQDLQRTQNLFSSAERELRYEREKNLDQKRHGALLEQENTKVKAELKQAQSRLAGVEQASASLCAELESSQQRGRELELELLHRTESVRVQRSLQEELRAESSRLLSADKKVRELQQQLKGAQHQLRLAETRVQEMEQLQREARDSTESLATLRGRLQEEQLCRKLLEQKGEELQQQLRLLREKEASLNRSNTELNHRLHQQGARLSVLEEEHSTVTDEHQHSQKTNQNLSDQLLSCQHESERLQEELRRVLHQLDSHVRRYSEKQARHKAKLRRAKEFFLRETVERDGRIRNLEKDLMLARSLTEKEQEWIRKVTDVNEKLLVEKRELLRRLSEEEELGQTCTRTISTRQHRLNCLEEENRQLQDRTLRLSNQVGALERALRSVQSVCSMEELKKAFPTESLLLNGSLLQPSNPSLTAGGCDTLGILDAIRRVKASEPPESLKSSFSTPRSQPSDIGYLNLSSPAARPGSQDPDESQSLGSDEV